MLRHRPSTLELGLEEEKREFGKDALCMFEPRPQALGCNKASETLFGKTEKPVVVGIFEVLEGAA
jgi:F420-dependent methylenetetrahydromethanopterin dehydrogenase